jgi:hypothetical protein
MVPWTRAINKTKLDWVLKNILDLDDTDILVLALDSMGYNSLTTVLSLTELQQAAIRYQPPPMTADPTVVLPQILVPDYQLGMLNWFILWGKTLQIKNNFLRLTPEQWENVTQDEYDTYRVGTYWSPQLSAQLSAQQVAGAGALLPTAAGQSVDLIADFQKGI